MGWPDLEPGGPSAAASSAKPPDRLCGRRGVGCGRCLRRWGHCHRRRIMGYFGVQRRRGDCERPSTIVKARCSIYLARGHGCTHSLRNRCEEEASTHLAMGGDCRSVPAHRSGHCADHPAFNLVPLLTTAKCHYRSPLLGDLPDPYRRLGGRPGGWPDRGCRPAAHTRSDVRGGSPALRPSPKVTGIICSPSYCEKENLQSRAAQDNRLVPTAGCAYSAQGQDRTIRARFE
jgi:hypothetical protein